MGLLAKSDTTKKSKLEQTSVVQPLGLLKTAEKKNSVFLQHLTEIYRISILMNNQY